MWLLHMSIFRVTPGIWSQISNCLDGESEIHTGQLNRCEWRDYGELTRRKWVIVIGICGKRRYSMLQEIPVEIRTKNHNLYIRTQIDASTTTGKNFNNL